MPFYRFEIDVDDPPPLAAERIRSIVREPLTFRELLGRMWTFDIPARAPFLGVVQDESFKIRRDIRYRNSFLPILRGRLTAHGLGTRVSVTMALHPLVAIFMGVWLGMVGFGIFRVPSSHSLIPVGMFLFGVALPLAGFIPEAVKAKRLLSDALAHSMPNAGPPGHPPISNRESFN